MNSIRLPLLSRMKMFGASSLKRPTNTMSAPLARSSRCAASALRMPKQMVDLEHRLPDLAMPAALDAIQPIEALQVRDADATVMKFEFDRHDLEKFSHAPLAVRAIFPRAEHAAPPGCIGEQVCAADAGRCGMLSVR